MFGKDGRLELMGSLEHKNWVDDRDDADRYVLNGTWFQSLAPPLHPDGVGLTVRGGLQWEREITNGDNGSTYSIHEFRTGVTFPLFRDLYGDLGVNLAQVNYRPGRQPVRRHGTSGRTLHDSPAGRQTDHGIPSGSISSSFTHIMIPTLSKAGRPPMILGETCIP